jgi:hypothetical protein
LSSGNKLFRWVAPFDAHSIAEAADIVGYNATFFRYIKGVRTMVDKSAFSPTANTTGEALAYIYFMPKALQSGLPLVL